VFASSLYFPQDMIFSDEEVEQDSGRSEAEEDAEPEHSPSTDAIPVSMINSRLLVVHN
jgi:hypothetical protein